jgi:hypothetical protein
MHHNRANSSPNGTIVVLYTYMMEYYNYMIYKN